MKHCILRKTFGVLLTLALLLTLTPKTEAATTYLYIGDSENVAAMQDNGGTDIVKGDGWLYNKSSKTLTLDNINLTSVHTESSGNNAYGIDCNDDLTIRVIGACNVAPTHDGSSEKLFGIAVSGNLTIEDAGNASATLSIGPKLSANGKPKSAAGINCGKKLTVKSITVDVTAPEVSFRNYGIYANAADFQSGAVTARTMPATDENSESYGISVQGDFTASGAAEVTGVAGSANSSHGVYVGVSYTMTLMGSAQVKGQSVATTGGTTVGVECGMLVCKNSARLTGLGGNAEKGRSIGVKSHGNITIQNSAEAEATSGTVTGKAYSYGMEISATSSTTVELTGGKLICTGGSAEYSSGSSYGFDGESRILVSGGEMDAKTADASAKGTGINLMGEASSIEVSNKGCVIAQGGGTALSAMRPASFAAAPSIRAGKDYDGEDAVFIGTNCKICDIRCNYVALDAARAPKFTSEPYIKDGRNGGKELAFSAQVPNGGAVRFIAAWFDADGRLLGIHASAEVKKTKKYSGSLSVGEDAARYKLLYLDANSFVPLCTAWSSN